METIAPISEEAATNIMVGGILGATLGAVAAITLVLWVLQIIAYWKIFKKAGEPGWKSIIPVYSQYTLYKATWNVPMFWVWFVLTIVTTVFAELVQTPDPNIVLTIIAFVLTIAFMVFTIMSYHKISKSFGHGVGFTLGLIFLWPIFILILGFGSSQYRGADL